jgi:hypothetical protein
LKATDETLNIVTIQTPSQSGLVYFWGRLARTEEPMNSNLPQSFTLTAAAHPGESVEAGDALLETLVREATECIGFKPATVQIRECVYISFANYTEKWKCWYRCDDLATGTFNRCDPPEFRS